jgi:acyl carrier protein
LRERIREQAQDRRRFAGAGRARDRHVLPQIIRRDPQFLTGNAPDDEDAKKIAADHLGFDESRVTPKASFIDDLGADSLDAVELVLAFEEASNVVIPEDVVERISSVKDAIEYIEQQKAT